MYKITIAAAAAALIDKVDASSDDHDDHHHGEANMPAGSEITWVVDSAKDEVTFTLKLLTNDSWIGFGLGSHSMAVGTDMVMCGRSSVGLVTCSDMVSAGEVKPNVDTK
jgi:hypothetical protein